MLGDCQYDDKDCIENWFLLVWQVYEMFLFLCGEGCKYCYELGQFGGWCEKQNGQDDNQQVDSGNDVSQQYVLGFGRQCGGNIGLELCVGMVEVVFMVVILCKGVIEFCGIEVGLVVIGEIQFGIGKLL